MDTGRLATLAGGALVFGFLFLPTLADDPWPAATQRGGSVALRGAAIAGELTSESPIVANDFAEARALGGGELGRIDAASNPAPLPVAAISVRIGARDAILVIRKKAVVASDDEADALFGADATVPSGQTYTESSDRGLRTASGATGAAPAGANAGAIGSTSVAPLPDWWSVVTGLGAVKRRDPLPVVSEIEQTRLVPDRAPRPALNPRRRPPLSHTPDATRRVVSDAMLSSEPNRDSDVRGPDKSMVSRNENGYPLAEVVRRDDTDDNPGSPTAPVRRLWETSEFYVEANAPPTPTPLPKPAKQIIVAEPLAAAATVPSSAEPAIVLPPAGSVAFTARLPTPPIDAGAARDVIAAGTVEQTMVAIDPRSRGTTGEWVELQNRNAVVLGLEGARAVSETKASLLVEPEPYAMIVGNSITGITRGALWTEYYAPDGTIKGIWGDKRYVARWSVNGELMCFDYPGSNNYCLVYYVDGDQALFFREGGNGARKSFKLLAGNPYDL